MTDLSVYESEASRYVHGVAMATATCLTACTQGSDHHDSKYEVTHGQKGDLLGHGAVVSTLGSKCVSRLMACLHLQHQTVYVTYHSLFEPPLHLMLLCYISLARLLVLIHILSVAERESHTRADQMSYLKYSNLTDVLETTIRKACH